MRKIFVEKGRQETRVRLRVSNPLFLLEHGTGAIKGIVRNETCLTNLCGKNIA